MSTSKQDGIRSQSKKSKLGITMGDPGGIGPEILVRLMGQQTIYRCCQPTIFGSYPVVESWAGSTRTKRFRVLSCLRKKDHAILRIKGAYGCFDFVSSWDHEGHRFKRGRICRVNGQASYDYLERAMSWMAQGHIQGLVTGPVSKKAIAMTHPSFVGHTEYLAKKARCSHVLMLFWTPKLCVALQTRHIPLKDVVKHIRAKELAASLTLLHDNLPLLGVPHPKIAVCGLNPHAGEDGLLGDEDRKILRPLIKRVQKKGIHAIGPVPADTAFYHARKARYDVVLAMYHDQGLPPFKMLAFDSGVQVTLGLPFMRTSVDHGTAFDIVGKGRASTQSFCAAIQLAARLHRASL